MRKLLAAFIFLLASATTTFAASGDTTWVQAQSEVQMPDYGNYDTSIVLPNGSKSYQRVFLYFTLGKYTCPGNPQFCSDWDYTVQTYLMTPAGDTFELARLITPYANSARMGANWKGIYAFDVTDYYPVLKDSATIRVHYSGYSGGFTADVRLAFIEGTPARNVLGLIRTWKNSYAYGHGALPINTALGNVSITAPANTAFAEDKFTITGHGGDAQFCAEFCPNTYTFLLNNQQLVQQNFWRADCGYNNYYPQNGTWVFDRAGWCPGDKVLPYSHSLPGVSGGSTFTVAAQFPLYVSYPGSSGSLASYTIENTVVFYGPFNKTLDASLEDVLAPTDNQAYFRMNPFVGKPVIKVKNQGSGDITSLKITYGVVGGSPEYYQWTGVLHSLGETLISLPEPWSLRIATGNDNRFFARILEVNGKADDEPGNDFIQSKFNAAPKWNVNLRISLKTNNATLSSGFSETSWKIFDLNDSVVAQRINTSPNMTYHDTVTLGPAVYRLQVEDAGCDGVNWWYPSPPNNPGAGYVQVRNLGSPMLQPLNGYFNGDFGCGFTQYFKTDWTTGVDQLSDETLSITAFPNPVRDLVVIQLNGVAAPHGRLQIRDAAGRIVMETKAEKYNNINTTSFANGLYQVIYTDNQNNKMQTQIIIAK